MPLENSPTATRLRAAGLRVTAPRVVVLEALEDMPHSDVDSVLRVVRRRLGAVSTQTIYDVLAALTEAGLVRRIEPAGSPGRFETRVGDNHHHVVCRSCGAVQDVDCAVRRRPCLTPVDTHGYVLDEAEVTFWGICPACQVGSEVMAVTPGGRRATPDSGPERSMEQKRKPVPGRKR